MAYIKRVRAVRRLHEDFPEFPAEAMPAQGGGVVDVEAPTRWEWFMLNFRSVKAKTRRNVRHVQPYASRYRNTV